MSIDMILTAIAAVIAAIAAAFGLGHSKGKNEAKSAAGKAESESVITATKTVAERQVKVTKEASDVKETINHLSDSAVDNELLNNWTRPGSGGR
ncbi:DUF2681 domain-containing protein [Dickeya poaceiphila]|uniref:DUF2681 domain-containing protein n=1 Tax=Dickeya poaceiphila TaxID=568768 RepID=A0A5B8I4M5_9GAMM|nr:DUF2681 domain-containing protein [Dickeya poaceiphila]QDX29543.1 DUF2681 domain-containing protein [Dickeya poaceiphila]